MTGRLRSLLATGALVAAACNPAPQTPFLTPELPSPNPAATGPVAECTPVPATPDPFGLGGNGDRYTPQVGPDGGTIVVGSRHPATSFDPLEAVTAGNLDIRAAVWSGLVTPTGTAKYAPDLARDVPTTQNGFVAVPGTDGDAMTVTWCLRDGLRWSDGAPLTCDDFAYTKEWLASVEPAPTAAFGDLRAIECPAPNVLVAHYATIFSGYVGRALPPMPRHYLEDMPVADLRAGAGFRMEDLSKLPVSGAFEFVSASPAEVRLARNPFYAGGARGATSFLDALTLRWYPTDDAAIAAFRAGQIEIAANLDQTGEQSPRLAGLESEESAIASFSYMTLRLNWSAGVGTDGNGGCSMNPLVARGQGCPTADEAIRYALAETIDLDAVGKQLTPNDHPLHGSLVPPDAYFFADVPPVIKDRAAAVRELDAAGWVDPQGTGIRAKNGLRAIVELCTSDDPREMRAGSLIAIEAAAVGIKVVVHSVPEATLEVPFGSAKRTSPCALSRSNFDMAIDLVTSSIEASDYRLRYHSSTFEPNGRNDARIADPLLDAALDKATGSADFVLVKNGMFAFQVEAAKRVLEIPLVTVRRLDLVSRRIGNWFAGEAPTTWNAVDWFLTG